MSELKQWSVGECDDDETPSWLDAETAEDAARMASEDDPDHEGSWYVIQCEPVDVAQDFAEWLDDYRIEHYDESTQECENARDWNKPLIDITTKEAQAVWQKHIAAAVRAFAAECPDCVGGMVRWIRGTERTIPVAPPPDSGPAA